jgi:hypothetical protein
MTFLGILPGNKKPFHSTGEGKGFQTQDLLVVRLIAVLSLTSTEQFHFIHPLSSMISSWYMHESGEEIGDRFKSLSKLSASFLS